MAQVVLIWGFFLAAMPWLILRFESSAQVAGFPPSLVGWVLFACFSAIGLYCAAIFVVRGKGTPLPLDTATRLVVLGPYRYVRNPMAVAGIGQGVSIGIALGSWLVIAYSVCGAFVWHLFARPWEERDLVQRFGQAYEAYRSAVPLWFPRRRAYPAIEADHQPSNIIDQ